MRRPAILLLAGAALLMPSSALARPRALDVFIPGGTSAIDPLQYPPEGGPGDPAFYTYGDISITRDGGHCGSRALPSPPTGSRRARGGR